MLTTQQIERLLILTPYEPPVFPSRDKIREITQQLLDDVGAVTSVTLSEEAGIHREYANKHLRRYAEEGWLVAETRKEQLRHPSGAVTTSRLLVFREAKAYA